MLINKKIGLKRKLNTSIFLGLLIFIPFAFFNMGIGFRMGLITFNMDKLIALWSLFGIWSSYLAYKKNKNPEIAFFVGFFLGPLAVFYYLVCRSELSKKEKEIYEWETEKKYKKMLEEKK